MRIRRIVGVCVLAIGVLAASGMAATDAEATSSPLTATFALTTTWAGGYTATFTIDNTGAATTSAWTLEFTLPAGSTLTDTWNGGTVTQAGDTVTATNASWNGSLTHGATADFGLQVA
jgi:endoglucanase